MSVCTQCVPSAATHKATLSSPRRARMPSRKPDADEARHAVDMETQQLKIPQAVLKCQILITRLESVFLRSAVFGKTSPAMSS
jgi:hypothetical protein